MLEYTLQPKDFAAAESELALPVHERSFNLLPTTRDVYGYYLFLKRFFRESNFQSHLAYFASQNFLAYYFKKYGTLRNSNMIAWDMTVTNGLNDVNVLDQAVYKLEKLNIADYQWFSRKYPMNNQRFHLERKNQIKKMVELNASNTEYFYPPMSGYRYGNEIYIVEGTRRISSILLDETESIKDVDIFVLDLVDVNGNFKAKNLHTYLQLAGATTKLALYDEMKIRNEPFANFHMFDYAQKREFHYPDIGHQLSAIIKYIMTNDKTDVEEIWNQINTIKSEFPK